jgi:hypothetical protein
VVSEKYVETIITFKIDTLQHVAQVQ